MWYRFLSFLIVLSVGKPVSRQSHSPVLISLTNVFVSESTFQDLQLEAQVTLEWLFKWNPGNYPLPNVVTTIPDCTTFS